MHGQGLGSTYCHSLLGCLFHHTSPTSSCGLSEDGALIPQMMRAQPDALFGTSTLFDIVFDLKFWGCGGSMDTKMWMLRRGALVEDDGWGVCFGQDHL